MNFYVFKTYTQDKKRLVLPYKNEYIVCESFFSDKRPTRVKAEATLAQSSNPYIIVPCTFLPNDESKWCFSINSDQPVTAKLLANDEEWPTFKGEWKGDSAGGCTNFLSFVNNPQYLIQVTKHSKYQIYLLQEEIPHEAFDTIGIYILKGDEGMTQKIWEFKQSNEIAHTDFKQPNEIVLHVDLAPGYYVIVPCTFNPSQEARYQLNIISNNPPGSIIELKHRKWITTMGEWKGDSAGGSINSKETWKNNPQFSLSVKKPLHLTINLIQERPHNSPNYGIGFWVFKGGKLLTAPTPTLVVHKGEYRPDKKVTEIIKLESSNESYVIVPTTFEKGQECRFTISITSDDPNLSDHIKIGPLMS